MRLVNGYACLNCGDEELARQSIDPAHPQRAFAGNEAFVAPAAAQFDPELGVNRPDPSAKLGSRLNLHA